MSMKKISQYTRDAIIADKIGVEGGLSNVPQDHGGLTNLGITEALARRYEVYLRATYHWDGAMAHLTSVMAAYVYTQEFWNPLNLDAILKVHPLLADKLFDIAINMGGGIAGRFLQEALNALNKAGNWYGNLVVDGALGNMSLLALKSYTQKRGLDLGIWHLLVMILSLQGARYIAITQSNESQEVFTDGWIDRAGRDMGRYSLLMNKAV